MYPSNWVTISRNVLTSNILIFFSWTGNCLFQTDLFGNSISEVIWTQEHLQDSIKVCLPWPFLFVFFSLSFNFRSWEKCVACRCSVGEGPFHFHLVKTDNPLKIIIIVVTSFTAWTGFCGRFLARKLKLWVFTPRRESYYLMKLRWGCYNSWSEVIFNYILQAFWEFFQYP